MDGRSMLAHVGKAFGSGRTVLVVRLPPELKPPGQKRAGIDSPRNGKDPALEPGQWEEANASLRRGYQ